MDDFLLVRGRADRGLHRRLYDSFLSQHTLSQANVISVMEWPHTTVHSLTHPLAVILLLGGTTELTHLEVTLELASAPVSVEFSIPFPTESD